MSWIDTWLSWKLALGTLKLMEEAGFGASKKGLVCIKNSNPKKVITAIKSLAVDKKLPIEEEFDKNGDHIMIFQIGQWGLKISGSQRLMVLVTEKENKVYVSLASKLTMGQIIDWGANKNNLEMVEKFLISNFQVVEYENEGESKVVLN